MTQPQTAAPQRRKKGSRRRARRRGVSPFAIMAAAGGLVVIALLIYAWSQNSTVQRDAQSDRRTLGSPSAKIVVEEFADFQCPICGEFSRSVEPQITQQYVNTNKVRFVFNHFVVVDGNVGGHESLSAAEASECAADQGKFWEYHDKLYANQAGEGKGAFSDPNLKNFATQIPGIDTAKFNQCLDSGQYKATVDASNRMAASLSLNGTPSLFVIAPDGTQIAIKDPMSFAEVQQVIDAQLAKLGGQ